MWAVAVVIVVFLILLLAEYLSRFKGVHSELTRKMVHILVGVFVAFWPFFLSWRQIQMLSIAFLIVVIVSIKINLFRSIHAVQRNALGELLFAMVIGLLAFISTDAYVFMAAMLFLSVADGMAAVVGLLKGDGNSYEVFGRTKSVAGSLAFFFSAVAIVIFYSMLSDSSYSAMTLLALPVVTTVIENVAVHGTDNLVIPLLVALVLTSA